MCCQCGTVCRGKGSPRNGRPGNSELVSRQVVNSVGVNLRAGLPVGGHLNAQAFSESGKVSADAGRGPIGCPDRVHPWSPLFHDAAHEFVDQVRVGTTVVSSDHHRLRHARKLDSCLFCEMRKLRRQKLGKVPRREATRLDCITARARERRQHVVLCQFATLGLRPLDPSAFAGHRVVQVPDDGLLDALRGSPVSLSTMGRGLEDDPVAFLAAAAAGRHAATLLSPPG